LTLILVKLAFLSALT